MKYSKNFNLLKAFTLVELMVAVSILAIGIVFIARAMVSNASALATGENRIEAIQFLVSKMAELEEKAREESGIKASHAQEQVSFNNHKATFIQEITPLEDEGLREELNQALLILVWKEGGINKDAALAGYFENKK